MNKIIAFLSIASVFNLIANTPELNFEVLKKAEKENQKQATSELNNAIFNCVKRSENLAAQMTFYAEFFLKKNPEGDLLKDEGFTTLFSRYHELHDACRMKIKAMNQINQIALTKIVVGR